MARTFAYVRVSTMAKRLPFRAVLGQQGHAERRPMTVDRGIQAIPVSSVTARACKGQDGGVLGDLSQCD